MNFNKEIFNQLENLSQYFSLLDEQTNYMKTNFEDIMNHFKNIMKKKKI